MFLNVKNLVFYRSAQMTGGSEAANHGIVSCNKELGVYIAMELFSGGISDDQMTGIAESVRIWKNNGLHAHQ